jgi:hypothetical protein
MKYAIEMGSGFTIYTYIQSFIKIGSGIQKLKGGIHRQTAWRSHKPTLGKWAKNDAF